MNMMNQPSVLGIHVILLSYFIVHPFASDNRIENCQTQTFCGDFDCIDQTIVTDCPAQTDSCHAIHCNGTFSCAFATINCRSTDCFLSCAGTRSCQDVNIIEHQNNVTLLCSGYESCNPISFSNNTEDTGCLNDTTDSSTTETTISPIISGDMCVSIQCNSGECNNITLSQCVCSDIFCSGSNSCSNTTIKCHGDCSIHCDSADDSSDPACSNLTVIKFDPNTYTDVLCVEDGTRDSCDGINFRTDEPEDCLSTCDLILCSPNNSSDQNSDCSGQVITTDRCTSVFCLQGGCSNSAIVCEEGDCDVVCDGDGSCQNTTIIQSDDVDVRITCGAGIDVCVGSQVISVPVESVPTQSPTRNCESIVCSESNPCSGTIRTICDRCANVFCDGIESCAFSRWEVFESVTLWCSDDRDSCLSAEIVQFGDQAESTVICREPEISCVGLSVFSEPLKECVATPRPTSFPTGSPTGFPSQSPSTEQPTQNPTAAPSRPTPTRGPSEQPTLQPTLTPTRNPTLNPSQNTTQSPTANPSHNSSQIPTLSPTFRPSANPTVSPLPNSTFSPTQNRTLVPTMNPTLNPVPNPTAKPTRKVQTRSPTIRPDIYPIPSHRPTKYPSKSPVFRPTSIYPESCPNQVTCDANRPCNSAKAIGGCDDCWSLVCEQDSCLDVVFVCGSKEECSLDCRNGVCEGLTVLDFTQDQSTLNTACKEPHCRLVRAHGSCDMLSAQRLIAENSSNSSSSGMSPLLIAALVLIAVVFAGLLGYCAFKYFPKKEERHLSHAVRPEITVTELTSHRPPNYTFTTL